MQAQPLSDENLPSIPEKRYFTIGEVAKLCGIKTHVLRYWEKEFDQLSPVKRNGNRRYYQRQDVLLVRQLCSLLYQQGYTIAGARQWLVGADAKSDDTKYKQLIRQSINELEDILGQLRKI